MSDSESIVFREHTANNSLQSENMQDALIQSSQMPSASPALDKPPLHHTNQLGSRMRSQPRPEAKHLKKSSAAAERSQDDAASENSQSIHFSFDGAEHNTSIASRASVRRASGRQPPPKRGGGHLELRLTHRRRSESQRTDSGDESIQFALETPNSHARPKTTAHSEASPNDSIFFHVVDDTRTDGVNSKASGNPQHDASTDGIEFTVLNETEGAAEGSLAKPVHTRTDAEKGREVELPFEKKRPKKTVLSNRLKRPHTILLRRGRVLNPPGTERSNGNKLKEDIPPATLSPAETGPLDAPAIPTLKPLEATEAQRDTNRMSPTAAPMPSKGEQYKSKATPKELGNSLFPTGRSRSTGSTDLMGIKNASTAAVKKSPEGSPPRSSIELPLPYPRPQSDFMQPSNLDALGEWIFQAKLCTEHWRLFNDFQREEIARLIERIAKARQPDSFLQAIDTDVKERKSTEAAPGGFANLYKQRVSAKQNADVCRSKSNAVPSKIKMASKVPQRARSATSHGISTCRSPPSGRTQEHRPSVAKQPKAAEAGQSPAAPHAPSRRAADGGCFSRFQDASSSNGVAKLAQTLGVVWPPSSPDALFFVSGARLTPQQRDEFYEAAELQKAAFAKLHAELQHSSAAQKTATKGARQKKVTPSRTSILRKAFDLMDVDKRGSIHTADLPALQHLLEAERQELELKAVDGVAASSFLTRARGERRNLKGTIDPKRPAAKPEDDATSIAKKVMLHGLVLDVIFPLIRASNLVVIDFSSLGLLVFGSLCLSQKGASASFVKWVQAALHYFEALA
ncbi:hypothetical protein MOQ_001665 [Trypanosoma cruzi marinkellei]|uniref:EF-hand domain-containing protein n=1 Tax=Trypanosoma cruzi marinkellei TaxID=85056 RepID=K2NK90_TRYCR|nr:hypothetical protein MOQ_001665 [Trypanosoma cruzi marinkellei]